MNKISFGMSCCNAVSLSEPAPAGRDRWVRTASALGTEPAWQHEQAHSLRPLYLTDRMPLPADGTTTLHALGELQSRGTLFIGSHADTYSGMIIGESAREADMEVRTAFHLSGYIILAFSASFPLPVFRHAGCECCAR